MLAVVQSFQRLLELAKQFHVPLLVAQGEVIIVDYDLVVSVYNDHVCFEVVMPQDLLDRGHRAACIE